MAQCIRIAFMNIRSAPRFEPTAFKLCESLHHCGIGAVIEIYMLIFIYIIYEFI